jgi:hypothetical protein
MSASPAASACTGSTCWNSICDDSHSWAANLSRWAGNEVGGTIGEGLLYNLTQQRRCFIPIEVGLPIASHEERLLLHGIIQGETMRSIWRAIVASALVIAGMHSPLVSQASAQAFTMGESLGGYGGLMSGADAGLSMGGAVIPYTGTFGGFMPTRMAGSGSLSFQSRGSSPLAQGRTSFSLSPMSSGMMKRPGSSTRPLTSISPGGGMGMGLPVSGANGRSVMPPSFGYPFRQPPSLISPASFGMGMSM